MRTWVLAFGLGAALAACSPPAAKQEAAPPAAEAPAPAATPVVSDAWAPPTMGGSKMAVGYLTIANPGGAPDRLVSIASPKAGKVDVHEMKMDGAMMTMAPVAGGVEIPAGGQVAFAPGGLHLMLADLTGPLAVGDTVPLTLTFEKAGAVEATLTVRARDAAAGAESHAH
ncbi:MAG: copper chaperone PCu(A)C [Alphaproteobacteria bacterium]|nr:copper chaperone PCu(A)C [Alphaproteobacteria bacterium]